MRYLKFLDAHFIPIIISISFFISLICYIGYLYGLGLSPINIPLSISDIANGILSFSPSIIIVIIYAYFYKYPNKTTLNASNNNEPTTKKINHIKIIILSLIFVSCVTWNAIIGTSLWTYLISASTLIFIITSFNNPLFFPIFLTCFLKLFLTTSVLIFSIGFVHGYLNFYTSNNKVQITLINNEKYTAAVLSNLIAGPLVKINNKIVFININQIKLIEYQPSMSYLEATSKNNQ